MSDDYYRHGELARAEARIEELEAEVDRLNTELARARAEVVAMEAWKDLALMRSWRDESIDVGTGKTGWSGERSTSDRSVTDD